MKQYLCTTSQFVFRKRWSNTNTTTGIYVLSTTKLNVLNKFNVRINKVSKKNESIELCAIEKFKSSKNANFICYSNSVVIKLSYRRVSAVARCCITAFKSFCWRVCKVQLMNHANILCATKFRCISTEFW